MITLGSLFDGIGGFPLAASQFNIKTLWTSEIDPACRRVTARHFPDVMQLGDITEIHGYDIQPVDIITFGSPCQDLSVAGNQAGITKKCPECKVEWAPEIDACPICDTPLVSTRSGLFLEAIQIIKEMRDKTDGQYPRFAIWENVPGAFSSNQGRDFQKVLEAFIGIGATGETQEPVRIPIPGSNRDSRGGPGRWPKSGMVRSDSVELAWRVLDAQFWGVPQRRKRIYLVADFGGQSGQPQEWKPRKVWRAGEILFKPECMSRYFTESRQTWEETTGAARDGINPASARTLNACKTGTGRLCADVDNFIISNAITAEEGQRSPRGDDGDNLIMCIQHSIIGRKPEAGAQGSGVRDDGKALTLDNRGSAHCVLYPEACAYTGTTQSDRIYDPAGVAPTMAFSHETGGPEITKILCFQENASSADSQPILENVGPPLRTTGRNAILAFACNQRDEVRDLGDQAGAVQAQPGMKQQTFITDPVLTLAIRGRGDSCQLEARDDGKANSLLTPSGGRAGIGVGAILHNYRVRRLTPVECERLQNFPDGWTEGESDSARYRMLGNSLALPCPGYVLGNIADVLESEWLLG